MEALSEELSKAGFQTSTEYRDRVAKLQTEWNAEVERLYNLTSKDGNVQTSIVGTLNEFMAPEDVVLCAAGSLPGICIVYGVRKFQRHIIWNMVSPAWAMKSQEDSEQRWPWKKEKSISLLAMEVI